MEKYEIKLNSGINLRILDDNLICIYGDENSSNYFIEFNRLLREISNQKYNNEFFIEKAILSYEVQKGKTYTFFKNNRFENYIEKYNWCQRPESTNMSLKKFEKNATICGYMSESLADEHGLEQIDLNTFIFEFVQHIIEENIKLKEENRNQRSQLNSAFSNGFIHKSKIEEKIKKYEKELEINKDNAMYQKIIYTSKEVIRKEIQDLKELLELLESEE